MDNNKRKVYLINPKFQIQFIAWMSGIAISTIAIFFIANAVFFKNLRKMGFDGGLSSDHVFFRFVTEQETEMKYITLVTAIVVLFVVVVLGLIISHKIAGPLHRFRMHLKISSEEKKLTKVIFRKDDFFTEIAEEYNNHITKLHD